MGRAKMGELKRAAQQLGVTSTTLRQQGWRAASPERIKAVGENPPDWLVSARECRAEQQRRREVNRTASRLGIQRRAVKDHNINLGAIEDLLADPPDWLRAEQERRRAQIDREAKDRLRRSVAEALVSSVQDAWFQELKRATSDAEADAIDARWAREIRAAKLEARRMVDEMTLGQVRARIDRESAAANTAARFRATQLARRAFGGEHG